MGVPKFFRYTSERYPCLNELVKQYQIPDFDNMYLDMNGIIHNCSHPDDTNPHFRITEEKIFEDIFHYIGILFQIIKPKKLFFMAIDGVAPRAKMNQQRGRRFRSAREAEKLEQDAKEKGEKLPSDKRFDSNCITPGTVFMARLHEQLQYFVKKKITTDPLWAKVKIVLSGHETPGEGEHKIMDYIRWARSQPDYDPNTRHCLYGLDADLIMLGMCTHEPHFALLREEVKFGQVKRVVCPEDTNFYLLHLSLLREYLHQEFINIKDSLSFEYDLEKIVDDWVLMGFLVGNDFIPNLPNIHIGEGALPMLYKTYMNVLPTLDGYINEMGDLNLARFEVFMAELAKIDKEMFEGTYADLKYFNAKTEESALRNGAPFRHNKPNNDETFNVNIEEIKAQPADDLQALINATDEILLDDIVFGEDETDLSDDEANFNMEFLSHKKDYYINKLDYSSVNDEMLASQAEGYVRAIQWNLWYYYKGCPSWCWYYPHHYSPFVSDIKGFKDLKIEFELGEPFKPFEQLLAVLPAASKELLPEPFHCLMTDENSPIIHYYPVDFETDLNGKKNDWEAVVLIPFIDEMNLLTAMSAGLLQLTEEERQRNSHGPMLVYDWTAEDQGPVQAPQYFGALASSHASVTSVRREQLAVAPALLRRGVLPGAETRRVLPGFPTFRHLPYKTCVKKCKVRVFDQPSRNENMIVQLTPIIDTDPMVQQVACEYLGQVVWVGWPHLTQAKVISVSNEKMRCHLLDVVSEIGVPEYSTELNVGNVHKQWLSERSTIVEHNMNRMGIELGNVKVILHAVNLKGYRYVAESNARLTAEPEWSPQAVGYALQAVVRAERYSQLGAASRGAAERLAFAPGERVFLVTPGPYYAALAEVVELESGAPRGRARVCVSAEAEAGCGEHAPPAPPAPPAPHYLTAHHAAAKAGISAQLLSRVTGVVLVAPGMRCRDVTPDMISKVNIGLNLKFNKKNEEVAGYTRRGGAGGGGSPEGWLYSERCASLVADYVRAFPDLFANLQRCLNQDLFYEAELWPQDVGAGKPGAAARWVGASAAARSPRRVCGSQALEPDQMASLRALRAARPPPSAPRPSVSLQVKLSMLYKPELHEGNISPDPNADFLLCDRVVCTSKSITVPYGAKGTITAIYKPSDTNTVRLADKLNMESTYQVMFDEPFPGGMTEGAFEVPCLYRMLACNMLNISFGRKLRSSNKRDAFVPTMLVPANVLRRDDGHHSAFVSHSPTKDRQTPNNDNRISTVTGRLPNQQDNSTEMLKSLLKISMPENTLSSSSKENKGKAEPNASWRSKKESAVPQEPPTSRPQPANWRSGNNERTQAKDSNEDWNKGHAFPKAPPIPPYPNFNDPMSPLTPMPPFLNQPFQQYNQRFGHPSGNNKQYNRPQQNTWFPTNLPNVSGNYRPPNNWLNPQQSAPPQETRHPFVPLQVQASRRRVQNPSVSSNRSERNAATNANPLSTPEVMPTAMQNAAFDNQNTPIETKPEGKKQYRKKKSRIAANLPFQTDK